MHRSATRTHAHVHRARMYITVAGVLCPRTDPARSGAALLQLRAQGEAEREETRTLGAALPR